MVGMVSRGWGGKSEVLLSSLRGCREVVSKMQRLRQLGELILTRDPTLLPAFAPRLTELTDQPSPVRKLLAEMIGQIGVKHVELLPKLVPTLISFLSDETPAVTRQAIISGTSLFSFTFEKVAIQGLHVSEMESSLEASWLSMLNFKHAVFPIAFEHGNDGVRLLAIKFIEALILCYTPDPNGTSEGPCQGQDDETGFDVSWLRSGHPILSVGDLSMEATQSLTSLLGQLRPPKVNSNSNSIIIVLINSLSSVAQKRPSFYGRILPVLLQLDPASSIIKEVDISNAFHALKNAFLAFLKCTHQGAAPWRSRLVEALKAMNAGKLTDQVINDLRASDSVSADTIVTKEERLHYRTYSESDSGRAGKRIKVEAMETDEMAERAWSSYMPSQAITESSPESLDLRGDHLPSSGLGCSPLDGQAGPLEQLIGVFGALVSQGDKAVDSLDILISNVPSDLLADMVMANMHNLPLTYPESEEEAPYLDPSASNSTGKQQLFTPSSSFLSNILSLSSTLSALDDQRTSHDSTLLKVKDEKISMNVDSTFPPCTSDAAKSATISNVLVPSVSMAIPGTEYALDLGSYIKKEVPLDGAIPGLGSMNYIDDIQGSLDASYSTTEHGGSQEQVVSSESTLLDATSLGMMSVCGSEQHVTGTGSVDVSEVTPSSGFVSSQLALPKMIAPVIDISNEHKDHLQKVSFTRILEAYKHVAAYGGSNIRLSLLACLGVEFPIELDVWDLLKKHISSDYSNHEGHELTLRVLYRLYSESEQDQDFFSSATATKDYEMFLLAVAESLRDLFPASDRSLSRLLGEVPFLPKSVIKLLECLCCPGIDEKHDKDFQGGDRVTQGLSAVWSLILMRPPSRDACLNIALQSAVHHLEEVRMKAIRLVANKLFPVPSIAQRIEEFASEMLVSVIDHITAESEGTFVGCSPKNSSKDAHTEEETPVTSNEPSSDRPSQSAPFSSIADAQRRMSLYFALCTKKHSLLRKFFSAYKNMPQPAKEAAHRHMPILVRTVGASAELLNIVSDPPTGCETVLMQVLRTLTEGAAPAQELIVSVKRLYENKLKNIEVIIPVLPFLSKEEVLPMFPQLVGLPSDKLQAAVSRILQGLPNSGPSLTPEEILIAIHGLDPDKDSVSLKKVMDACTSCFEQRHIFTQQVIAKVLNQLVEQIPLPLLFMRTVIQAIGTYPALVDFVMDILSRLVNKQIWKYPKLWVGFLKCAVQTKPQSFNVLLQLPAAQLENALNRNPILKAPIVEHASQSNVRSTLPRSTLQVLGLVSEPQASVPAQTSESQAADASNSTADGGAEATEETASVT